MSIFEDKTIFSKRLAEAMKHRGMRQKDLVKATGITPSAMSRYLSCELLPRIENTKRIADALKVDPMWLFGFDDAVDMRREDTYNFCPWCGKHL